ncbi:MAG: ATP-binding protein [Planctomycetes bacterium]|nr:ATP-binding protein [Planctomycetota bacterium]
MQARPECGCAVKNHVPRLVVLTGGPGAGKTAVLEVIRRRFCEHVVVLPEAASILFGGGFPRRDSLPARRAAQRAIVRVQRELERMAIEEGNAGVILCDRGTLDGLAYWPGDAADFWRELDSTPAAELARYSAVIHLGVPRDGHGYGHSNPVRTESAHEAAAIDLRIEQAWSAHPRHFEIPNTADFLEKMRQALERIRAEVPECCRSNAIPATA